MNGWLLIVITWVLAGVIGWNIGPLDWTRSFVVLLAAIGLFVTGVAMGMLS